MIENFIVIGIIISTVLVIIMFFTEEDTKLFEIINCIYWIVIVVIWVFLLYQTIVRL